jgi:hypothetical protein
MKLFMELLNQRQVRKRLYIVVALRHQTALKIQEMLCMEALQAALLVLRL